MSADLQLFLTRQPLGPDRFGLSFVLLEEDADGELAHRPASVELQVDPFEYLRDLYRRMESWGRYGEETAVELEDRLWSSGVELCRNLLPEGVRERLVERSASSAVLQVISGETWFPWELLALPRRQDGKKLILAEVYRLVRWLDDAQTVRHLPMRRIGVVAPSDSGLPGAEAEQEFLRAMVGPDTPVEEVETIEPRYSAVKAALDSGELDALHFICHSRAERHRLIIELENGAELSSEELEGTRSGLARSRPLIFLNACQSGMGVAGPTDPTGWSRVFLAAGAGAFIAPQWSVRDRRSVAFAEAFYRSFLTGRTLGEATLEARQQIKSKFPGDPHRLAYAVYGDPQAHCGEVTGADMEETSSPGKSEPDLLHEEYEEQAAKSRRSDFAPRAPTRDDEPAPSPIIVTEVAQEGAGTAEPASEPGARRVHSADATVLVLVPAGLYPLGAEDCGEEAKPVHFVSLSAFWIGRFPVTNEQYAAFLASHPEMTPPPHRDEQDFNQPQQPIVGVTWHEAEAYCRWVGLNLPTEAQWEAAARGQDLRKYPWGDDPPTPLHANYGADHRGPTVVDAHPAGEGPFGTCDQAGNVWEWCADGWSRNAYGERGERSRDPVESSGNDVRVVRGGSWLNPRSDLRAAVRERAGVETRYNSQGFRCVWTPPVD